MQHNSNKKQAEFILGQKKGKKKSYSKPAEQHIIRDGEDLAMGKGHPGT